MQQQQIHILDNGIVLGKINENDVNITIEKNNIIGAGATVINNIEENNNTYVGVPAKVLKKQVKYEHFVFIIIRYKQF